MATKNQIRAGLRKKKKAGLLPPQVCPNPRCKADLSDPDVPPEHADFREMFGLAREVAVSATEAVWLCPVCGKSSGKHASTLGRKASGGRG